ncbi:MAG TPA: hypothetical protein ENJ30_09975 [Desulfobulbaceae bacterium]|nr:hypothetical protein [Desulfobulbaceae bacterium]
MTSNQTKQETAVPASRRDDTGRNKERPLCYYRIRFRRTGREYTASSTIASLEQGHLVLVKTDHGPEPAMVFGRAAGCPKKQGKRGVSYIVLRRATQEEEEKYARLPILESEAYDICRAEITTLKLPMHLVRVERFFNGSKIIFYFTADSRVDFRELVKRLVQEFRTRVEMRQIGVRHETQMIGGLGACGRELCCTAFLKRFDSVSIKMAKAQDLPLNPTKISGVCNRLLCCLTYEYDSYRTMKKGMPKVGRLLSFDGRTYRVVRQLPLQGELVVVGDDGEDRTLTEEEWRAAQPVHKKPQRQRKNRKKSKTTRKRGERRSRKKNSGGKKTA